MYVYPQLFKQFYAIIEATTKRKEIIYIYLSSWGYCN